MHDHLAAGPVHPGGVASQDDRQAVGGDPDPAEGPDVVMVQRGGPDGDGLPALGEGRVRTLAELKSGQRVVGIEAGGGDGEHARTLTRAAGSMRTPRKATARAR